MIKETDLKADFHEYLRSNILSKQKVHFKNLLQNKAIFDFSLPGERKPVLSHLNLFSHVLTFTIRQEQKQLNRRNSKEQSFIRTQQFLKETRLLTISNQAVVIEVITKANTRLSSPSQKSRVVMNKIYEDIQWAGGRTESSRGQSCTHL